MKVRVKAPRFRSICHYRLFVQREQSAQRIHPTTEAPSGEMLLPRLDGVHIFVVDDEPDVRASCYEPCWKIRGSKVTSFASAEDALAAIKTVKPTIPPAILACQRWMGIS